MLPLTHVMALIGAMFVHNQLMTAHLVRTATTAALSQGAAAGAAVGAAAGAVVTHPQASFNVLQSAFRVANWPFWVLSGGPGREARLRTLEQIHQQTEAARRGFVEGLRIRRLELDALTIHLRDDYIESIRNGLANDGGPVVNPSPPSFFSKGVFTDPFNENYTIFVFNDHAVKVITCVCVVVVSVSMVVIFSYTIRIVIRQALKASKALSDMINEEKSKLDINDNKRPPLLLDSPSKGQDFTDEDQRLSYARVIRP